MSCFYFVDSSSDPSISSGVSFLPIVNSVRVVASVSFDIPSISKGISPFITQLMTILFLVEMVFVVVFWEIFQVRIYLNLVLLLLLPNFVSGSRLELMCCPVPNCTEIKFHFWKYFTTHFVLLCLRPLLTKFHQTTASILLASLPPVLLLNLWYIKRNCKTGNFPILSQNQIKLKKLL